MLEPEIIAYLEQQHGLGLADIQEPLVSVPLSSGSAIERLTLTSTTGDSTTYVIKRLRPLDSWVARATRDERMRAYQFAASAIPSALPAGTGTAVLRATALATGGAALIMRDVTAYLPPAGQPLTASQTTQTVTALARLHSTYYGFPARLMSGIGLCTLGNWLSLFAPATARREDASATATIPAMLIPGWEAFAKHCPDAWRILEPLLNDPQPLVAALRHCPDTLIHGAVIADHIAFEADQTVLLDWGLCARAPGALDLGWFLGASASQLPVPPEVVIETYRAERERLRRLPAHGEQWERELALALLAGTMRIGWALALRAVSDDERVLSRAQAEDVWWAGAVSRAERWL